MKSANHLKVMKSLLVVFSMAALCFGGCVQVKTDPIKIEPIYIEITVNHKVQKELDDVFADIDAASETMEYGSADSSGN